MKHLRYAAGDKAGHERALSLSDSEIREYAANPDLWIEDAIDSAFNAGYTDPDARETEEYVAGYEDGAIATTHARASSR